MGIKEAVALHEKKKQEAQKLMSEIYSLRDEINKFCESKVGWLVEQFGFKYYIVKYKDGVLLGRRLKKDTWGLITKESLELIHVDECEFIGKAEIKEDNFVKLIYT